MKQPNKGGKRIVPQPGGEVSLTFEGGPLIYSYPMPPVKSRGRLTPAGECLKIEAGPPMSPEEWKAYCEREGILLADRPLVPTTEEVAKLPAPARGAFATRCAARVAPLATGPAAAALDPVAAAAVLLASATVQTPVRRLLLCIRRDFDRLASLAKKHNWTDETPVPPEVFGPMWPKNLTPAWAKEPPQAPPSQG